MIEFDSRTIAHMDMVLEDTCRILEHGGDHESRKYVAERLMQCARGGHTAIADLNAAAREALSEISKRNAIS
jgi:hypothetical protein